MTLTQQINAYLDTLQKPLIKEYRNSIEKHVDTICEKFGVDRNTAEDILIDYILASK
jgi:hypothetical protein